MDQLNHVCAKCGDNRVSAGSQMVRYPEFVCLIVIDNYRDFYMELAENLLSKTIF
jgi:hypothetical protein